MLSSYKEDKMDTKKDEKKSFIMGSKAGNGTPIRLSTSNKFTRASEEGTHPLYSSQNDFDLDSSKWTKSNQEVFQQEQMDSQMEQENKKPARMSLFSQRMKEKSSIMQKGKIESSDLLFGNILTNVNEKSNNNDPSSIKRFIPPSTGFPTALHRSMKQNKIELTRARRNGTPDIGRIQNKKPNQLSTSIFKSMKIDDEDPTVGEIHNENINKLDSMSSEELDAMMEELTSKFDGGVLEFLKKSAINKYKYKDSSTDKVQEDIPNIVINEDFKEMDIKKPANRISEDLSILKAIQENSSVIQPVIVDKDMDHNFKIKNSHALKPKNTNIIQEFDKAISNGLLENSKTWVPAEDLELEKLEWINSEYKDKDKKIEKQEESRVNQASIISKLRFDLSGNIIIDSQNLPTHLGLHHHGDDPDMAGYTITEITRLLRSTSHSQRIAALNVTKYILDKIFVNYYDKINLEFIPESKLVLNIHSVSLSSQILQFISQNHLLLILRVCLDDTHNQVILATLDCILSYMGLGDSLDYDMQKEDDECIHRLFDKFSLVRGCNRQFGLSNRDLKYFLYRSTLQGTIPTGLEDDIINGGETTTEKRLTAVMQMSEDYISGLLITSIVDRLNYLMDSPLVNNKIAHLSILRIIYKISLSSKTLIETYIADCPGLINLMVKKFLCIQWPLPGDNDISIYTELASWTLRILRNISLCSRKMALGLIELNIIDVISRFIFCGVFSTRDIKKGVKDTSLICTLILQARSWQLLQTFLDYGLSGQFIDNYRLPLYEYCKDIFGLDAHINNNSIKLDGELSKSMIFSAVHETQTSFLNFLTSLIESFGSNLHLGDSTDDSFEPFFNILLSKERFNLFFENNIVSPESILLQQAYLSCLAQYMRNVNILEHKIRLNSLSQSSSAVLNGRSVESICAIIENDDTIVNKVDLNLNKNLLKYVENLKLEITENLKTYIEKVIFVSVFKDIAAKIDNIEDLSKESFFFSYGKHLGMLSNECALKLASSLSKFSGLCQLFNSSIILISEVYSYTKSLQKKRDNGLWNFLISDFYKFIEMLTPSIFQTSYNNTENVPCGSQFHSLSIRQFAPTFSRLLVTIVEEIKDISKDSDLQDDLYKWKLVLATTALNNMMPGDEYFASKIYYKYIAYMVSDKLFVDSTNEENDNDESLRIKSLCDIRETIEKKFYDEETVFESGKYFARHTGYPSSLFIQFGGFTEKEIDSNENDNEKQIVRIRRRTLPVPRTWPLVLIPLLKPVQPNAANENKFKASDFQVAFRIIAESLNFITVYNNSREEILSNHPKLDNVFTNFYRNDVISYCIQVFLCGGTKGNDLDEDGGHQDIYSNVFPLFREPDIESLLKYMIEDYQNYDKKSKTELLSLTDLDLAMGENGRFYSLYEELLDQYESVSFGNSAFADYLSLPLRNSKYPTDYKKQFLMKLNDILHTFNAEIQNLIH